ncbi:protein of unknown function [Methylacidimicrobium sp. AP8]|uniref:hypothetical protein n=1 Tax=Methylacidimicrobium sp. AP8 TaxID=2730359 RepID=UPI0018C0E621|nr:hypothetical protein [Methylacidimicrobium sp. AP8]CAB4243018.1 protein of unknown function [Methylacidimicrobium sp. AP8]
MNVQPVREEQSEGRLLGILAVFLILTASVVFSGWGYLNACLEASGGIGDGIGSLVCLGLFLLLAQLFGQFLLRYAEAGDEFRRRQEG